LDCSIVAHPHVLKAERCNRHCCHCDRKEIGHEHACDCKRRHRCGQHRHRLARHAFDDAFGGERAEERTGPGNTEYRRVASGFDVESRIDDKGNARITDAQQQFAGTARGNGEPHLRMLQLRQSGTPITRLCRHRNVVSVRLQFWPTTEQYTDSRIPFRRRNVQRNCYRKNETNIQEFQSRCDAHPDKPRNHAEQQRH